MPLLVERDIGVIGMKPFSAGMLFKTNTVTAIEALHYAMNLPTDVVVTGMESLTCLEQAIEAAASFRPLSNDEVASLLGRTAPMARSGEFERYKTTEGHDSTSMHPEWLGSA